MRERSGFSGNGSMNSVVSRRTLAEKLAASESVDGVRIVLQASLLVVILIVVAEIGARWM